LHEVGGIISHSGVYNTQPLDDYITDFMNKHGSQFKRKINVLAVDANSGSAIAYDENT